MPDAESFVLDLALEAQSILNSNVELRQRAANLWNDKYSQTAYRKKMARALRERRIRGEKIDRKPGFQTYKDQFRAGWIFLHRISDALNTLRLGDVLKWQRLSADSPEVPLILLMSAMILRPDFHANEWNVDEDTPWDQESAFGRYAAGVGALSSLRDAQDRVGRLLKPLAAAVKIAWACKNERDSNTPSLERSGEQSSGVDAPETPEECVQAGLRKQMDAMDRQHRELNNAIIAERAKNPHWIELSDGPDGQEYRDKQREIAQITARAGGPYAVCENPELANKIFPLHERVTALEKKYACADAPSIPLLIQRLRQADAWINVFLPSQEHAIEQRNELARNTMFPIRRMMLQLILENPSLPEAPPAQNDARDDLYEIQKWATKAQQNRATPDPIQSVDSAKLNPTTATILKPSEFAAIAGIGKPRASEMQKTGPLTLGRAREERQKHDGRRRGIKAGATDIASGATGEVAPPPHMPPRQKMKMECKNCGERFVDSAGLAACPKCGTDNFGPV